MKRLASAVLAGLGASACFARRNRRRLPILMYHGLVERRLSPKCWHQLDVASFERQIAWVARRYRILPLGDALVALMAGTLPERSLAITFDDGYRSNLELALPILERYRAPATVFLVTDLVSARKGSDPDRSPALSSDRSGTDPDRSEGVTWPDRLYLALARARRPSVTSALFGLAAAPLTTDGERARAYETAVRAAKALPRAEKDAVLARLLVDLGVDGPFDAGPFRVMSWDDVAALTASGLVTVASHTRTHQILSRCDDATVRAEVGPAHEELVRRTGRAPNVMAYPVGRATDYDARSVAAVEATGIPFALTTIEGLAGPESSPRELPRLGIGHDLAFSRFRLLVSGALEAFRGRR